MKKLISKLFTPSNREQKIKEPCSGDKIYSGWAYNLGCAPTTNFSIPVDMYGLSGIISVAEGTYHSAALKEDGTVWTWGV